MRVSWLVQRRGEEFWLAWWLPGALDARARTVGWTAVRGAAREFDTREQADAVVTGLVPVGFLCEVVEVDDGGDHERNTANVEKAR